MCQFLPVHKKSSISFTCYLTIATVTEYNLQKYPFKNYLYSRSAINQSILSSFERFHTQLVWVFLALSLNVFLIQKVPIGKDCRVRTEKRPKRHSKCALSVFINCKNSVSHQSFLNLSYNTVSSVELEWLGRRKFWNYAALEVKWGKRVDSEKSSQKKTIWQTSKITKIFHYWIDSCL